MSVEHPSLLSLIGWRMVITSLLFMGLLIVSMQTRLEYAAVGLRRQVAEADARDLARHLFRDGDGVLRLRVPPGEAPPALQHAYAVLDADGRVIVSSRIPLAPLAAHVPPEPTLVDPSWPAGPLSDVGYFELGAWSTNDRAIGVTLRVLVGGVPAYVQVAEAYRPGGILLDELVNEFFVSVGWLLIPGLALLLAINLLTIHVELGRLRQASDLVTSIGPKETAVRLPEENLPGEVFPLIRAVNQALDRLDRGFKAQREFTADAAHELRTPLAVLRAHIDTLPDRALAKSLSQDVDAMTRIVNQLLRIAQLETLTVAPDERADLHAVAVEIAGFLAPLAVAAGKSIAVNAPDGAVMVWGNEDALGQAVRNLAENALAHTPPDTAVEIDVRPEPALSVRDRGPGIPSEQRARIFQRFWRGDTRRGGAGLGMAIVARIVEAHGGTISVDDAPGGGACITLHLRKAPPEKEEGPQAAPLKV